MDDQGAPKNGGRGAADDHRRLEAIIEQVRGELVLGEVDDARSKVRERLEEAGLSASDNDVDAVLSAVDGASSEG